MPDHFGIIRDVLQSFFFFLIDIAMSGVAKLGF